MDAAGETEVHGILELDGLIEVFRMHETEHRTEDFGEVEERTGLDPVLDTRAPQTTRIIELLGLEQPGFAGFERRQRPTQLFRGVLRQWAHGRGEVRGPIDDHRRGGIDELATVAFGIVGRSDHDAQRGGRALLSGMSEGRVHEVGHGQVAVCCRGDDQGVLTGGLGIDVEFGAEGLEHRCGLRSPREDDAVDIGVRDEVLAELPFDRCAQLQHVLGHSGLPQAVDDERRTVRRRSRGFVDDCGSGCESCNGAAGGNRYGEVPRGSDDDHLVRGELRALELLELERIQRVVADEVDGLGHLGVGLRRHLADLGGLDGDELAATGREDIRGSVEDLGSTGSTEGPPIRSGGATAGDHLIELVRGTDLGRIRTVIEISGGGRLGDDPAHPFLVGRKGRVGVGLVEELGRHHGLTESFGRPILVAVRGRCGLTLGLEDRFELVDGCGEPVGFALEHVIAVGEVEDSGHEVLRRRVLLEATHEVGDRDVELLRVHGGNVQEEVSDVLGHGRSLLAGHALEHLELDAVSH